MSLLLPSRDHNLCVLRQYLYSVCRHILIKTKYSHFSTQTLFHKCLAFGPLSSAAMGMGMGMAMTHSSAAMGMGMGMAMTHSSAAIVCR